MPEISCEEEWYERVKWMAVAPAIAVYLVVIPALMWYQLKKNAHWISHSGRANQFLTEEEEENTVATKSAFGFFVTGLTISKKLDRPLDKNDFPIENDGTTDPELKYNNYKVCCQGAREFFIKACY